MHNIKEGATTDFVFINVYGIGLYLLQLTIFLYKYEGISADLVFSVIDSGFFSFELDYIPSSFFRHFFEGASTDLVMDVNDFGFCLLLQPAGHHPEA